MSETDIGRQCIAWSSIPASKSTLYSSILQSNYCRNPQGIGKRPWCYTNAKTREWNYCPVPNCGKIKDENNADMKIQDTMIILVILVFGLCFGCMVMRYVIKRRSNRNNDETHIDPYNVFYLNNSEQIVL